MVTIREKKKSSKSHLWSEKLKYQNKVWISNCMNTTVKSIMFRKTDSDCINGYKDKGKVKVINCGLLIVDKLNQAVGVTAPSYGL